MSAKSHEVDESFFTDGASEMPLLIDASKMVYINGDALFYMRQRLADLLGVSCEDLANNSRECGIIHSVAHIEDNGALVIYVWIKLKCLTWEFVPTEWKWKSNKKSPA